MDAYRSGEINPETGKGVIRIGKAGPGDIPMQLPCGKCIGCRLNRSREWAVRLMHEAQMHERNCYLTLTYDDKYLPGDLSLDVRHVQAFMKRLRDSIYPKKIKYFHCGEYGEDFARPHYHMILFGHDFRDKIWFKKNETGDDLFISPELAYRWKLGHCTLGAVTFQSAAYVSQYTLKKRTGPQAEKHYLVDVVDPETGEITRHQRTPEYSTGSNGLGEKWLERYHEDVYPHGYVVVNNGNLSRPPRYYDKWMEKRDKQVLCDLRKARRDYSRRHAEDSTPERLDVREAVATARQKLKPRKLK